MTITTESLLAILGLIIGPSSIVGVVVKTWSDARAKARTIETTAAADQVKAKADADAAQAKALADAWARMVDAAEKREAGANDRTDRSIASNAALTDALKELTAVNTLVLEKISAYIIHEQQSSRPQPQSHYDRS